MAPWLIIRKVTTSHPTPVFACAGIMLGFMRTPLFQRRTQNALASHRRRAKAAGARLDYGLDDLREVVLAALNRPCVYCRRLVVDENFACDHAEATGRGGSFRLENIRVCCKRCNETKGCLSDEEFSALLLLMAGWPERARADVLRRLRAGGRAHRR